MDKGGLFIGSMKSSMPVFVPSTLEENKNAFVIGEIGMGKQVRGDVPVKYFEDNPVFFPKDSGLAYYQLSDRNVK